MITINDTEDLFQFLTAALPYEYSEHLNKNTETIKITKENSDIVVYIAEDETEPGIFNAASYPSETDDDSLCEGIYWDVTLQTITPAGITNDIKQLF
jgi:hypothetical protein